MAGSNQLTPEPSRGTSGNPSRGVDRVELVRYLATLLDADTGADWAVNNGLQVEGNTIVRTVVTGVSSCQRLFDEAAQRSADAVIVHHGLFWHGQSPLLTGVMGRRVRTLLANNINLLAYHLPLDRHEELGNNAVAAKALGLAEITSFALAKGLPIGFAGRFPTPISVAELTALCATVFERKPLVFDGGPDRIRTVGIVSGGAAHSLHEAIAEGLDAFITGEPEEWAMNLAHEAGVHFFAAGHHATERLGVRVLGEHLAEHFDLDVTFADVQNPV